MIYNLKHRSCNINKKNIPIYKIPLRTMMGTILKTSNNLVCQQVKNSPRSFAAIAGKTKTKNTDESNLFVKQVLNNHAQYITDFNIIYENPDNIKLYSIASLHTKPRETSYTVSSDLNYRLESKPQHIQFHKKVQCVTHDLHIIKNSKQYFDNSNIKENIEKTLEYKNLFNSVILELNTKAIKYKIAQSEDDFLQTGFNTFLQKHKLSSTNNLIDTLHITKNNDQE